MANLIKTGALLAALIVCTQAGASTLPTALPTDIARPTLGVEAAGPIASPGDAFLPDAPNMGMKAAGATDFPCYVGVREDGMLYVVVTNGSGEALPLGTIVDISFSNGEKMGALFQNGKWYPNGKIHELLVFWEGPLTCRAEVRPIHAEVDDLLSKLR